MPVHATTILVRVDVAMCLLCLHGCATDLSPRRNCLSEFWHSIAPAPLRSSYKKYFGAPISKGGWNKDQASGLTINVV